MKYRLYVDEVGNSDLGSSSDPNHRFLSLTGVIIELGYVEAVVYPEMEALKRRYFGSHPDDPVVFHRKKLVNERSPFDALQDPAVKQAFNIEISKCLRRWEYQVISAIIDKQQQNEQFLIWRYDPYHYCLTALVERYVLWLQHASALGDVMAESRGGREDMRLKTSFERIVEEGSEWVKPEEIQRRLTSRQLKVKSKANNITGLQLADLLGHASFREALNRQNGKPPAHDFVGHIASVLWTAKYHRSPTGKVEGWGVEWLP
jgi:hypothetical protein